MNCYYLKSCTFAPQIKRTMEQKFKKSDEGIDLRALREFCRKEGKSETVFRVLAGTFSPSETPNRVPVGTFSPPATMTGRLVGDF